MKFKAYLQNEINKPTNEYYEPNGNSARAIVVRGVWREILWQYKAYPKRLKYAFKEFEGLATPVGWFLQTPVMVFLSPLLPVTAGLYWYKRSMGEYREQWANIKNNCICCPPADHSV